MSDDYFTYYYDDEPTWTGCPICEPSSDKKPDPYCLFCGGNGYAPDDQGLWSEQQLYIWREKQRAKEDTTS